MLALAGLLAAPAGVIGTGARETVVQLEERNDSGASGEAIVRVYSPERPRIHVFAKGLDKAPRDHSYVLWLRHRPNRAYPLAPLDVGRDGKVDETFLIPGPLLPRARRATVIDVTLASNKKLSEAVQEAVQENEVATRHLGALKLLGRIR